MVYKQEKKKEIKKPTPRNSMKWLRCTSRTKIRMPVDFSTESMQVRRQWSYTFKLLRRGEKPINPESIPKNNYQSRILHPTKYFPKVKVKQNLFQIKEKKKPQREYVIADLLYKKVTKISSSWMKMILETSQNLDL